MLYFSSLKEISLKSQFRLYLINNNSRYFGNVHILSSTIRSSIGRFVCVILLGCNYTIKNNYSPIKQQLSTPKRWFHIMATVLSNGKIPEEKNGDFSFSQVIPISSLYKFQIKIHRPHQRVIIFPDIFIYSLIEADEAFGYFKQSGKEV